jgi:hypothetical protein
VGNAVALAIEHQTPASAAEAVQTAGV